MHSEKPIIIVTRKLPQAVQARMRELFDAQLNLDDKPMTREDLIRAVQTADVLVPTVTDRIDRAVLSQAGPRLKLIANFGTGVDNIDLEIARNRGIIVTNTPDVLNDAVAELTVGMMIALSRHIPQADAYVRRGKWLDKGYPLMRELNGARAGILGLGRIGQ